MRPIRELIEAEVERAETDLESFRSRSIGVVTTSSGIVTLLTGVFAFAASKAEDDAGLPDAAIVLLALALTMFVAAAIAALIANRGSDVDKPSTDSLEGYLSEKKWAEGEADPVGEERRVADVLLRYLVSVRALSDKTATKLNVAVGLQIVGVVLTATGGVVAMLTLN